MSRPILRGGKKARRNGKPLRRGLPLPLGLTITTTALGPVVEGQAIAAPGLAVTAVNGTPNMTWELISPPSWASISGTSRTGRILGTPDADGTVNLTVKVTDSLGATSQVVIPLEVTANTPLLDITTTTLSTSGLIATQLIESPGLPVSCINGALPMTWEKVAGPAWGTISGTGRTARLNGTPPSAGDVSFTFKVTDALGVTDTQVVTGTVMTAPAGVNITTTSFSDMVVNQSLGSPGLALNSTGGVSPFTWEKLSTGSGSGWATVSGTGQVGRVTGTPDAVGNGKSIVVKVTDANGLTDTQTITYDIIAQSTTGQTPLYYRKIGFTKNLASDAQMKIIYDEIFANTTGAKRIIGGLVRYDLGGPTWGGSGVTQMKSDIETRMNKIVNEGQMFSAPIIGYTASGDQRRITFQGQILTGQNVGWKNQAGTGYQVGWNLQAQMGDAGRTINGTAHPARRPTSSNNYYRGSIGAGKLGGSGFYGTGNGVGVTCHGPGIPYVKDAAITLDTTTNASGTTIVAWNPPTGDNPGADVPDATWIGQGISCSGLPAGSKITAKTSAGHWRVDNAATASGARTGVVGIYRGTDVPGAYCCTTQESGALVFGTDGGNTAAGDFHVGASGTYYIGGTNQGQDIKIWYDDPLDFEKLAAAVADASNNTVQRVKRIEPWNEMPWAMGCRPTVDIARAARMLCHAYVGIKKKDPSITVCLPGPGDITNSTSNFLTAPDFAEALLEFWYNTDPDYFTDLKTARGVVKTFASKVPGDEQGIHPYTNTPLAANDASFAQIANVYNQIGAATGGDYLPMAPTEQGVGWSRGGTGGNNLGPAAAYTAQKAYIDVFHGNVPWPNNVHFAAGSPGAKAHLPTGPTDSTHISLADRRDAMALVISCATFFAVREPPGSSGPYGIGWDSARTPVGGNQKYFPGGSTPDPLKAIGDA